MKTLKDLKIECEKEVNPKYPEIYKAYQGAINNFYLRQRQEVIKRIDFLESMGTICGRWVANEWRTFIDYYEKKPHTTKYEKKYALIQIKKIIKNYNIIEKDLK
ncbi:MAG: hypothetical protein ACTSUT_13270 [Promethearchaeota archaeon]